jgi:hypothetical protein
METIIKSELRTKWTKIAQDALQGKTITDVRYLNDSEMRMMGWHKCPIVFLLNDGTRCVLSSDDEGNDGGSLFYGFDGVLPTL